MIGIFDSGIGGLTVFKEIARLLPDYDLAYFGDMARLPYGTRTKETITRYAKEVTAFLINQGAKIIIVACNSATANALPALQQEFPALPVLGVIVPAVEAALAVSKHKIIGVVCTRATVTSGAYAREIFKRDALVRVKQQACPLLVPLIEEGWTNKLETRRISKTYLLPLKHAQIDTLILGCTHYPLIKPIFKSLMGNKVAIIDSAAATAHKLREYLLNHAQLAASLSRKGKREFYVTDAAARFTAFAKRFLGPQFSQATLLDLAALETSSKSIPLSIG